MFKAPALPSGFIKRVLSTQFPDTLYYFLTWELASCACPD